MRGTNWTQTAANQWDPAHHAGGPNAFPRLLSNGTAVYGGVPQAADLHAHLAALSDAVERLIPDPSFDGVAVVDWEAWRPLSAENYDSLTACAKP